MPSKEDPACSQRLSRPRLGTLLFAAAISVLSVLALAAPAFAGEPEGLPQNTAAPSIGGQLGVEEQATASPGEWQSSRGTPTFTYQWLRCDAGSGESCEAISGANGSAFTPEPNQVGYRLRVLVTAHNEAGEQTAESAPTAVVPEVSYINALITYVGAQSAEITGQLQLASQPGGGLPPPWVEACAQWRRTPSEPWSQNCEEADTGSEGHSSCTETSQYEIYCQPPVPMAGLDPGTEYEARLVVVDNGLEASTGVATFLTEGEGPPRTEGQPTVSGSWVAGETMEAGPGPWTGVQPMSFSYMWELCSGEPTVCMPVGEPASASFVVPAEDVAETSEPSRLLRVKVTASNTYGEATSISEEHEALAAPASFSTAGPVLEGEAEEGQTLTIGHYAIAGAPAPSVTYEWQRCDEAGEVCEAIAGASAASYEVGSEDVGHTIRAVVTASNSEYKGGGEASEATPASAIVVAPPPVPCSAGSWSVSGDEPCGAATPGHYAPGSGRTSQLDCAAGTYNPEEGSTSPVSCLRSPPGAWAGKGSADYTKCPAGTFEATFSAVSAAACLADPPGTWTAEFAWETNPCHAGTYASGTNNTGCTPAALGHYAEGEEASAQLPCGPGTYAGMTSLARCAKAPAGSFVPGEAASAPTPCPAGTYSEAPGASSCTTTPPDTYATGGAARPTQCPPGTEAPAGAGSCSAAAGGGGSESTGGPREEHRIGSGAAEGGGSGYGAPGGGGGSGAASARPSISGLSVSHACVSARVFAAAVKGLVRHSGGAGIVARFRLNEAARVSYTIARLSGMPRRNSCHGAAPKSHKKARAVPVGSGSASVAGGAGSVGVTRALLAGRARAVKDGAYALTLVARNASGVASAPVSVEVWVVGR